MNIGVPHQVGTYFEAGNSDNQKSDKEESKTKDFFLNSLLTKFKKKSCLGKKMFDKSILDKFKRDYERRRDCRKKAIPKPSIKKLNLSSCFVTYDVLAERYRDNDFNRFGFRIEMPDCRHSMKRSIFAIGTKAKTERGRK